jgi:hypothetical protein
VPTDLLLSEIADGQGEPLAVAARRLPPSRRGRPVTLSCLLRWVTSGVRLPDGTRLRLEAARCAGRWLTTPGAIRRFVDAQTPRLNGAAPETPRAPSARRRAAERAERELAKIGI